MIEQKCGSQRGRKIKRQREVKRKIYKDRTAKRHR